MLGERISMIWFLGASSNIVGVIILVLEKENKNKEYLNNKKDL